MLSMVSRCPRGRRAARARGRRPEMGRHPAWLRPASCRKRPARARARRGTVTVARAGGRSEVTRSRGQRPPERRPGSGGDSSREVTPAWAAWHAPGLALWTTRPVAIPDSGNAHGAERRRRRWPRSLRLSRAASAALLRPPRRHWIQAASSASVEPGGADRESGRTADRGQPPEPRSVAQGSTRARRRGRSGSSCARLSERA